MRRRQLHLARAAAIAVAVVSLLLANATAAAAKDNPRRALFDSRPAPASGTVAASPPLTQEPKVGEYTSLSLGVQGGCNFSLQTDIRELGEEDGGVYRRASPLPRSCRLDSIGPITATTA